MSSEPKKRNPFGLISGIGVSFIGTPLFLLISGTSPVGLQFSSLFPVVCICISSVMLAVLYGHSHAFGLWVAALVVVGIGSDNELGLVGLVLSVLGGYFVYIYRIGGILSIIAALIVLIIADENLLRLAFGAGIGLLVASVGTSIIRGIYKPITGIARTGVKAILVFLMAYLLTGLYFGVLYKLASSTSPGYAFSNSVPNTTESFGSVIYFSYVALLSGNTVTNMEPSSTVTKVLYLLEVFTGTLWLVLYVGFLFMRMEWASGGRTGNS